MHRCTPNNARTATGVCCLTCACTILDHNSIGLANYLYLMIVMYRLPDQPHEPVEDDATEAAASRSVGIMAISLCSFIVGGVVALDVSKIVIVLYTHVTNSRV